MANKVYYSKTTLTGGGGTALDSIDGNDLTDGDFAFVTISGVQYLYRLNATSGAAESVPNIISPDANAGNKRWLLQRPESRAKLGSFTIDATTTGNQSITGVGFQPVFLELLMGIDGTKYMGRSMTDGINMAGIFDSKQGTEGVYYVADDFLTMYYQDANNTSWSVISSFDADGFTITKSKANSPTGTLTVYYKAS